MPCQLEQWCGFCCFGTSHSVENNEKDDSTEILKNIGDVFKIDGSHPQSAIESDADIVIVPSDED